MKERKFLLVSALFSRQHYSHTKEAYARIKDTCTRTKETYTQVKRDQYHIKECKTKKLPKKTKKPPPTGPVTHTAFNWSNTLCHTNTRSLSVTHTHKRAEQI